MPRVMIVDDNSAVRDMLGLILKSKGYEVIESDSGKDCLEKLKNDGKRPGLIFLDVMMPGMDGWEVSKRIKTDDKLKDIVICILTAKDSDMDERMSYEYANADLHIKKPASKKDILLIAEKILGPATLLDISKDKEKNSDSEEDFELNPGASKHSYDFL